jgi:hypothetical protein
MTGGSIVPILSHRGDGHTTTASLRYGAIDDVVDDVIIDDV